MVRRSGGFTYLAVLFAVAILSSGLALAGTLWQTQAQREKEAQLLHVGNAYRQAIRHYYENTPSGMPRRLERLEQLIKDERYPDTRRYLRRLYPDPITGSAKWGLVLAVDGSIVGVYTLSGRAPLKTGNFRLRDADFTGAKTYADWKFIHRPILPVR